jgi:hypothetical protein
MYPRGKNAITALSMSHNDHNLHRYLETEGLLNAFFSAFGYCRSRCIPSEPAEGGARSLAGCCTRRHFLIHDLEHPSFGRLRRERERRYGRPEDHRRSAPASPCEYHDSATGCRLATHKSPVCLAFLCPEAIAALRGEFSLFTYDYLGVYYALEWILTGDLPELHYRQFRKGILEMTAAVQRKVPCGRRPDGDTMTGVAFERGAASDRHGDSSWSG